VGNYVTEKIIQLNDKVVTIAEAFGYVNDPEGIACEKLEYMYKLWTVYRESAKAYADKFSSRDLSPEADFSMIASAIIHNTIDVASLIGVYGPAKKPLQGS
jgi:hypothetical protein